MTSRKKTNCGMDKYVIDYKEHIHKEDDNLSQIETECSFVANEAL